MPRIALGESSKDSRVTIPWPTTALFFWPTAVRFDLIALYQDSSCWRVLPSWFDPYLKKSRFNAGARRSVGPCQSPRANKQSATAPPQEEPITSRGGWSTARRISLTATSAHLVRESRAAACRNLFQLVTSKTGRLQASRNALLNTLFVLVGRHHEICKSGTRIWEGYFS